MFASNWAMLLAAAATNDETVGHEVPPRLRNENAKFVDSTAKKPEISSYLARSRSLATPQKIASHNSL
jgi:hypothetical protein